MDIRVLNYFITIVQTKNISNAADALHVTQPTLSRQIKELEQELDTILFHRGSREIQLTDDGQYLYNRAIEILNLVDKTETSIRGSKDLVGDIFIGAAETQSLDVVARAVKTLIDSYPDARLHIRSGNAEDILENLNQGVYDFGITFGPFNTKKYHHLSLPNRDLWGAIVPKGHPLTKIERPTLADTLAYPLILSSQTKTESTLLTGLGDYRIVATYNLLYNATTLVKNGVGIALGLNGIIETDFEDSQLDFVTLSSSNFDTLQMIWKKQSSQSALAKKFLEHVRQELE